MILLLSLFTLYTGFSFFLAEASADKLFSAGESPFGVPFHTWVEKWWNWDYSIPLDPETNQFAGLKDGGCFIHSEGSVVMLVDTAAGGKYNQNCTISSGQGILIPIWTGECDQSIKGYETATFKTLSKCARDFDLGKVSGHVTVDNIPIARLDTNDYNTNIMQNVSEINTPEFNLTVPANSHFPIVRSGIFPGAAHGWFVFLKPLSPGEHIIYYQNGVEPTTLSGAGNVNSAEFTYHLKVK